MGRTLTFILVAASVTIAVAGQILLKLGVERVGRVDTFRDIISRDFLWGAVTTWQIPLAVVMYGVGFVLWMAVLSRESLSYAYPFLALTYIVAVFADSVLLGTSVPPLRWVGAALVTAGLGVVWST